MCAAGLETKKRDVKKEGKVMMMIDVTELSTSFKLSLKMFEVTRKEQKAMYLVC